MNGVLYLAVVLIWGTTWIAIFLQQTAAQTPVLTAVFWRFLMAAVVMLLVLRLAKRLHKLNRRDHAFCVIQGCCVFGFNFVCFYHAAAWISTGLESVIFSMAVLYNALNSWIFFRQRPAFRFLPATVLGLGGMIALFWHDIQTADSHPHLLWGVGLSALGTLGFSLGNMIALRHQRQRCDILTTNSYAMLYGALIMGALAWVRGEALTPTWNLQWMGALSYLALFGSVIGFGAYFTLVGRIGASQAAYSTLLFPLVALTLSTFYEGYTWHANAIIGLMMILVGNAVMFVRWPRVYRSQTA